MKAKKKVKRETLTGGKQVSSGCSSSESRGGKNNNRLRIQVLASVLSHVTMASIMEQLVNKIGDIHVSSVPEPHSTAILNLRGNRTAINLTVNQE